MNVQAHPCRCRDGSDAARQGHLACLEALHQQGSFLGFHNPERAGAGEDRKAQAWLAALAACDGRQPAVLRWLLAGGWPLSDAERLPWHFRDVGDPRTLTWYTGERPSLEPSFTTSHPFTRCSVVDGTAIDWDAPGEWSELAELAGFCRKPSHALRIELNGRIRHRSGACQEWFPQEFQVLWRACRSGDLACQQAIVEAGCRSRWVSVLAALTGQLDFLRFAVEHGCLCEGSTLVAAAAGGHVDTFIYVLHSCAGNVGKCRLQVEKDAGHVGSPDCTPTWFFSERFEYDYGRKHWDRESETRLDDWVLKAAIAASENGHLDVLEYVMARHARMIKKAGSVNPASAAVAHGRLSCLECAHKHGCMPDPESVAVALRAGHTDCVPYLISHDLELTWFFQGLTAQLGQLDLLKLRMGGVDELDRGAADGAATGGQLTCLRYALENGRPAISEHLLWYAASGGSVSCMRYLHEKGYTALPETLMVAVQSGSVECVEYAFEIGCRQDTDLMVDAACLDVALVQCLHERGCPWEKGTTDAAARRGCLATLQYCHENGCPWDPVSIPAAIGANSLSCLQYIHTHKCPPLPRRCPPAYNLEVLRYAVEHMGEWGKGVLQATGKHLQAHNQHQFADWRLLMYMAQRKVALPPVLQQATDARSARFEAVVTCFHLATRLAAHGGPHAPMWDAMGRLPHVLTERVTQWANLRL